MKVSTFQIPQVKAPNCSHRYAMTCCGQAARHALQLSFGHEDEYQNDSCQGVLDARDDLMCDVSMLD